MTPTTREHEPKSKEHLRTERRLALHAMAGWGRRYRWRILASSALASSAAFTELATALLVAEIVSIITSGGSRSEAVSLVPDTIAFSPETAVLLLLPLAIIRAALDAGDGMLRSGLTADIDADLRLNLARHFLHTDWPSQQAMGSGLLQELSTTFVTQARLAARAVSDLIATSSSILILTIGAMRLGGLAFVGIAALATLTFVLLSPLIRRARAASRNMSGTSPRYAHELSNTVRAIRPIRVYGVESALQARLEVHAQRLRHALRRYSFAIAALPVLHQLMATCILALSLLYILQLPTDTATASLAISLLAFRILQQGRAVQSAYQTITSALPYIAGYEQALARLPSVPRAICHHDDSAQSSNAPPASLQAIDIHYRYPDSYKDVLTGASLTVASGSITAIVGRSGSGKSTLTQLLLGLRKPDRGTILVDGIDLASIAPTAWHSQIATVDQEPVLFDDTVAANVRFFRPTITDDEVVRSLERSHILDEVNHLTSGIDTPVFGEKATVSGGQAQRVCIARALAGRPRILILDEPTSALDEKAEQGILETISELRGSTTILIITHRRAVLRVCDEVYELVDGTIQPAR